MIVKSAGQLWLAISYWLTLICQYNEFSVSPVQKRNRLVHRVSFSCVGEVCAGEEAGVAVSSAAKSGAAACNEHFRQEDHLPVIRVCKVYNHLLFKSSTANRMPDVCLPLHHSFGFKISK